MKETIRTWSTREQANTLPSKKKKIEVNSVGKDAMGREHWKPREGIKGSLMSVKKRFIQTQICVRGGWGAGGS